MAALQKLPQLSTTSTTASSYEASSRADLVADQFPAGLRVLVVDDDITCLRILEQMLRRCLYHVTTCSQATVALNLLRERKGCFDLVLSDVHMPDMDGFKLLELVGLEMDLPVIMVSADGRTSAVMRGIRHGACDYLIKPIREEELKNIWQHVVRKKWNGNKEPEHSGSLDETDRHKRGSDEAEYASSVTEGTEGILKTQKKRRDSKEEDDDELENDDPASSKKPRVVWSVELHQQFVSAVNQLGIDKAVPKRILELMNVPGLTRENVASHLQKFRLYLKRLSGVAQQQGGIPNSFCGPGEPNVKLGPLGRFDIQALAASGQIPPQTLAALHAELLGQPTNNLVLDQPALLQASLHGQPLMKCPSNISKHFPHPIISAEDVHPRFGSWPSNTLSTVGPTSNLTGLGAQSGNMLMGMLQQQQHQQKQSMLPESSRLINVQPSCLVVPSQARNSPSLVNQSGFNRSSAVNYSLLSPQSNDSSFSAGQMSDRDLQKTGALHGYSAVGVASPSMSSCLANADNGGDRPVQNPNQGSYSYRTGQTLDQGPLKNLGFVGKGTSIPSRFAVDEPESPVNNLNYEKVYGESKGNRVKQEPNVDFNDNAKVGIPILPHFPSGDLMSVFSE